MTEQPVNCPLCGGPATYQTPDGTYWDGMAHHWRIPVEPLPQPEAAVSEGNWSLAQPSPLRYVPSVTTNSTTPPAAVSKGTLYLTGLAKDLRRQAGFAEIPRVSVEQFEQLTAQPQPAGTEPRLRTAYWNLNSELAALKQIHEQCVKALALAWARSSDIRLAYEVPRLFIQAGTRTAYRDGYEASYRGWDISQPYTSRRHQIAYLQGVADGNAAALAAAAKLEAKDSGTKEKEAGQ